MLILEKYPTIHPNFHLSLTSYSWKQSYDHIAITTFQWQFLHLHQYRWHLIFEFICERMHSAALKGVAADSNLLLMFLCVYLRGLKMVHYPTLFLILAGFLIIFLMNFKGFRRFNLLLPNKIHLTRLSHLTKSFTNF